MLIFIGGDHAGYKLKETLIDYLGGFGHEVIDKGPFEFNPDDDYPDFVRNVALAVSDEISPERAERVEGPIGIVIGGGGQGEAIVCNRVPGIRASVFYGPRQAVEAVDIAGKQSTDPYETVRLSREHNNANILSLGARFVTEDESKQAAKIFIESKFSGDERHIRRIKKIDK
ncbi:MAG: Ribose 5-phosphate isomerase [Candidatus Nomurabacteria bacterium GW2011_GWB1_37_5]|uniref:Ribose 5-phosphate isomerase n=1 Tax=Candidatus Nomurabacteria bacterium GW2011_GWB1_37_5 TaxID=1618742 RepID=A0A0G0H784_9BACT|nr:MAG: Ribose 5-phosphate isomerase [Candidatus Nomurabacteria bacterium GW2011_GWB1_37_5]